MLQCVVGRWTYHGTLFPERRGLLNREVQMRGAHFDGVPSCCGINGGRDGERDGGGEETERRRRVVLFDNSPCR